MNKQPVDGKRRRVTPEQRAQRMNQFIFGLLAFIIILSMIISLVRY